MRNILLFIISLLTFACGGKQENHEIVIEQYYKSNLHDPNSYELVRIGLPKEVTRISAIYKVGMERGEEFSVIERKASEYAKELQGKGIDPAEVIAYEVEHRYRAKNALGALVLENEIVVLDPTMSEVIKVLDNGK